MTSMNAPIRLAAASLPACSSSEDAGSADGSVEPAEKDDSSGVFDFTESSMGPAESIEFRIPDELVDLTDGYAKTRVFESITVSATEIEGSSGCGVEYQFEYVEGGFERLEKYFDYEESKDNSREDFWVLASSEFTVMQNGDLFVHNPEVDGFQLDSNGSWIKG